MRQHARDARCQYKLHGDQPPSFGCSNPPCWCRTRRAGPARAAAPSPLHPVQTRPPHPASRPGSAPPCPAGCCRCWVGAAACGPYVARWGVGRRAWLQGRARQRWRQRRQSGGGGGAGSQGFGAPAHTALLTTRARCPRRCGCATHRPRQSPRRKGWCRPARAPGTSARGMAARRTSPMP